VICCNAEVRDGEMLYVHRWRSISIPVRLDVRYANNNRGVYTREKLVPFERFTGDADFFFLAIEIMVTRTFSAPIQSLST
jgi:hypothetical protein